MEYKKQKIGMIMEYYDCKDITKTTKDNMINLTKVFLENENINVTDWIIKNCSEDEFYVSMMICELFRIFGIHGFIDEMKQIYWRNAITINENCNIGEIFYLCAVKGYGEIVKWMYLNFNINQYTLCEAFIIVCLNGHIEIARYITKYNHFDMEKIKNIDIVRLFKILCINGFLYEAQKLYEKNEVLQKQNMNNVFFDCCMNSNYEMVEWIWKTFKIDANVIENAHEKCVGLTRLFIEKILV